MIKSLTKEVVTKRIKPDGSGWTVAAGTSAVNSDIVDTAGYEGVRFILSMGTIVSGAATSSKVQQNIANSGTGMADLEGSSITIADTHDNKLVIHEIFKPKEQYLRLAISRATQEATIDSLHVELFNPRTMAVTQDSTVATAETYQSPAEGTA